MARGEQRVRGNDTWENGRREGRKDGRGEEGKTERLWPVTSKDKTSKRADNECDSESHS